MRTWTTDELSAFATTDEMQITTYRRDGDPRTPLPIWMVTYGDAVYIRSTNGLDAAWYRAASGQGEGQVTVGRTTEDVTFASVEENVEDAVDAAYRTKYARYARIAEHMTEPGPRATTLKVTPR